MKNITYDPIADAVYVRLKDAKIVDSETIASGVIYDYDENNQIVGMEILSVKKRTPEELKSINLPFKLEDKQQLKKLFTIFSCVV